MQNSKCKVHSYPNFALCLLHFIFSTGAVECEKHPVENYTAKKYFTQPVDKLGKTTNPAVDKKS